MTPTEINREFAEKVMGWDIIDRASGPGWIACDKISQEHAAMGLEKFEEWRAWKSNGKYAAVVGFGYMARVADTAPAAICLACIKAKKEKE